MALPQWRGAVETAAACAEPGARIRVDQAPDEPPSKRERPDALGRLCPDEMTSRVFVTRYSVRTEPGRPWIVLRVASAHASK